MDSDPKVLDDFCDKTTAFLTAMMTATPERPAIKNEEMVSGLIDALVRVSKEAPTGMGLSLLHAIAFRSLERLNSELYGPGKVDAPARSGVSDSAAKKIPAKRVRGTALMKQLTPSAELAAVVGSEALPRMDAFNKLWVYIRKNNLQDAVNKRLINNDAVLKKIFGKPQVDMFEVAGLLGKQLS